MTIVAHILSLEHSVHILTNCFVNATSSVIAITSCSTNILNGLSSMILRTSHFQNTISAISTYNYMVTFTSINCVHCNSKSSQDFHYHLHQPTTGKAPVWSVQFGQKFQKQTLISSRLSWTNGLGMEEILNYFIHLFTSLHSLHSG